MAALEQPVHQTRVHAFGDDALGDHDAVGLAEEIKAGRVSRLEAVEAAIDRIHAVDDEVAGLAAERFASALAEARTPHDGFFAGQPSFVKDNSDVAGLPTQQGTRAYVAEPAPDDGDFARMLGLLGTTTLGKTRLSEYGFSASAEYMDDVPVRNPWHTDHTSGASSAGSAAFVAAGAVAMAHANDGGGSIRIPAACCGLVGLKPTRGRTPSDKINREMPVKIVHDGVVTRSVRDTAAFLAGVRAGLPQSQAPSGRRRDRPRQEATARRPGHRLHRRAEDRRRDRAGRAAHRGPARGARPHGRARRATGRGHLRGRLPALLELDWRCSSRRTGRYTFNSTYDRSLNDNLTKGLARHAARNAWRLPLAIARLNLSHRTSKRFFADHDVVLTPTLSLTTPEIGWLNPSQSYETVIGAPAGVGGVHARSRTRPATRRSRLPMGTSTKGLPIGVHAGRGAGL